MVDKVSNSGSVLQLPKHSVKELKHSPTDVKIKKISKSCFEALDEFLKKILDFVWGKIKCSIKWIGKILCCKKQTQEEDCSGWDDSFDSDKPPINLSRERAKLDAKLKELDQKMVELDEVIALATSLNDEGNLQKLKLEKEKLVSAEKDLKIWLESLKIEEIFRKERLEAKRREWLEKQAEMKRGAFSKTYELAKKIQQSIFEGTDKPRGLINIRASSCYMNSALQAFEILFQYNLHFKILLNLDLSLHEGETLAELEKRVLHLWMPLTRLPEESNEQYSERILLKWNLLLLMQAKHFIGDKVLEEAIRLHHDLCFALGLHHEFTEEEFEQKDVASYMEMLLQTLQEKPLTFKSFDQAIDYQLINQSLAEEVIANEPAIESLQLLQVPMSKPLDAQKLIEKFFGGEVMDHGDSPRDYYKDGRIVATADKSMRVCKLVGESPETLKVHFKRFSWFENDSHKIDTDIRPFEDGVVDLRDYYQAGEPGKTDAIYSLIAFVVHNGTLDSGHYKVYVKKKIMRKGRLHQQWFCCNDESVTEVRRRKVPKGQSYIGVFRKL